jgi:molybdopterin molybdotransferase
MKPGKPLAFGEVFRADGSSAWFIGLPGNPVSSFVTFLLAVRPVLLRLQGASELAPRPIAMRADFAWPKPDRRREFLRVRRNGAGGLDLFGHQGSAVLTSTIWADGLVDNPPGPGDRAGRHGSLPVAAGVARMKVAVRYFASVREALGPGEESRSAPGPTSPRCATR